MYPHLPNKLIATKYCFVLVRDETSFVSFTKIIFLFLSSVVLHYFIYFGIINVYKNYFIIIIIILFINIFFIKDILIFYVMK